MGSTTQWADFQNIPAVVGEPVAVAVAVEAAVAIANAVAAAGYDVIVAVAAIGALRAIVDAAVAGFARAVEGGR